MTTPLVCHTRRERIAGYESVHYGSLETGYRDLCSRCFNEEVARLGGLKFEHVQFESIEMMDAAGEPHRFHFSVRLNGERAYVEDNGVDGIQGRTWARGYMRGTRLAPEGWSRIFSDDSEGLVLTIPVAAGEVDPEWPKEPMTPERNDEILQSMLAGAARAYRYFREDRIAYVRAAARPEPYERAGPKIGRNDPFPCGSGKKYERCGGGAGAQDDSAH